MKLDSFEIKFVNIARWNERSQFFKLGLREHFSIFELGRCFEIGFNPTLDVFPVWQCWSFRAYYRWELGASEKKDEKKQQ